jgi:hypothetical protein
MVLQHQAMPRLNTTEAAGRTDSVDWNEVSKDYYKWVMGPWDKVMMTADPQHSNERRNFLSMNLSNIKPAPARMISEF